MIDVVHFLAAQSASPTADPSPGGSLLSMLPILAGMLVFMYFLMIRPEQKKQKEQATLLGSLKRGDEVMLTSGFFGKIHAIDEKTITLELGDGASANKQRVRVLKNAVMGPAQRFLGSAEASKALEAKDEKKDADADKKAAEKTA